MRIIEINAMRGPDYWSIRRHKLIVMVLDLEEMEDKKEAEKKKTIIDILDKTVGYAVNVAGIVLPLLVTIWGTKVTLEFEQEGNVTTIMGKGFFNKLLPKK